MSRRPSIAVQRSVPAPIDGLNYRDPISALKPTEALLLDNMFPATTSISLRKGFSAHKTSFPAAVETLMEYSNAAGRKLFAASGTGIYDATSSGAVGAAVLSSLTNARWQHVNFTSAAGTQYLIMVNGADGVRTWDGSTWATQTITGATAANFKNVCAFGKRLWFVENSSTKVWYLDVEAIAGAATALDLGSQLQLGGVIAFATPVSFSAGAGLETLIAFVSTNGEVLVYQGQNPGAADFGIIGRFRCGRPTGDRGYLRVGGDVIVLTEYGIVSLSQLAQIGLEQAPRASFSNKIDRVLGEQRRLYSTTFGFQMIDYPQGSFAVINMPQTSGVYVQYVMNTLTGAWCRFTGMNARCWGLLSENLYFGGATAVYKADDTFADNGAAIVGKVKSSFSHLGVQGTKRFTMMRPLLTANGSPVISMGVNTDYGDTAPDAVTLSQTTDALWGTGLWDVMRWGGASALKQDWLAVAGMGVAAAFRMETATIGMQLQLHAVDLMFEPVRSAAL